MATEIIDEAMRVYGGKQWRFESLAAPRCESKTSASIENPMSISDFLSCCRPLNGLRAATMMLVDVQQDVENCGSAENVAAVCQEQRIESLPAALQFAHALPAHSKVGCIAMEKGHGKLDVIKLVTFQDKMAIRDATKIPAGSAYVPFSRPGPWAVKKAFQSLLDRLPGHHVHWGTVTRWEAQAKNSASSSSTWSPDTDTLLQGVAFINDYAPETDANNEQYTWILLNIREDAESPIAGWPEGKVRIMAQNKSKASNGATLQKGFPLTTFSLKPFLAEKLLPVLYPLFVCYGVVALGWPGVGKTPALIAVILAMGRYHIHRLQEEDAVPGWRRAKSLDNFRHQVANVYEGIFLDDPNRENVSMADLKSFLTVEEEQTTSGRYNDAKLTRNCMRAYASNDLDREDEPLDDSRIFITGEEFMKMTRRLFAGKNVILHTDSAKSYRAQVPGMLHDRVVHKKTRVKVGNKFRWVAPKYVEVQKHRLPGGKVMQVKSGTQIVDRCWRFLKERVTLNQQACVGARMLCMQLRSGQYEYWNRGKDLWTCTGALVQWYLG